MTQRTFVNPASWEAGSGAGTDRLKSGVKVQLAGDPESQPNSDTESIQRSDEPFVLLQRQTRGNSVSVPICRELGRNERNSITHLKKTDSRNSR